MSFEVFERDPEKEARRELKRMQTDFKSDFNFLNTHNGIRYGKMHVIMAPTHSGKSTLVRTLLKDLVKNNQEKTGLVWLTEETKEEFESEFQKCLDGSFDAECFASYSEMDNVPLDFESQLDMIEKSILELDADYLLLDNITTSAFYMDQDPKKQAQFAVRLKKISKMCGLIVIAHTNGDSYNTTLLTENNIRGSKTISNLTEFLYIMQPVSINNSLFQFVMLKKNRGQAVVDKIFKLVYEKRTSLFSHDRPINFDDFKDTFKQRNKL